MADTKDGLISTIHKDPNFAVICSFLTKYGTLLGLSDISFEQLEKWIDDTRYVNVSLKDILIRLLKRWRSSVNIERFPQYLVKFCHTYSQLDAWELEGVGFQRCNVATKLRIIKNLLECQFDVNAKFKEKINEIPVTELRSLPLGRDITGRAYWFQLDNEMNMRIYCEEQDDVQNETWQIVVSDRNQLSNLIASLVEQKSRQDEKSRSVTPSTIESDVASIDTCSRGFLFDACVSESSSDAKLINEKFLKDPSKICTSVTENSLESSQKDTKDEEKNLVAKQEPEWNEKVDSPSLKLDDNFVSSDKVKSEDCKKAYVTVNCHSSGDSLRIKLKCSHDFVKQEPGVSAGDGDSTAESTKPPTNFHDTGQRQNLTDGGQFVENSHDDVQKNSRAVENKSDASSNSNRSSIDERLPADDAGSSDVCKETVADSAQAENSFTSETAKDNKTCEDVDQISAKTPTPRKVKKPVERLTCSSETTVTKTSVKRKRSSTQRRLSSSSSEDAGEVPAAGSESELSESPACESRSQSAGEEEEEPPTKRKREKALKTASERDRKLNRVRMTLTKSPLGHSLGVIDSAQVGDGETEHHAADTDGKSTAVLEDCTETTDDVKAVGDEIIEQHKESPAGPVTSNLSVANSEICCRNDLPADKCDASTRSSQPCEPVENTAAEAGCEEASAVHSGTDGIVEREDKLIDPSVNKIDSPAVDNCVGVSERKAENADVVNDQVDSSREKAPAKLDGSTVEDIKDTIGTDNANKAANSVEKEAIVSGKITAKCTSEVTVHNGFTEYDNEGEPNSCETKLNREEQTSENERAPPSAQPVPDSSKEKENEEESVEKGQDKDEEVVQETAVNSQPVAGSETSGVDAKENSEQAEDTSLPALNTRSRCKKTGRRGRKKRARANNSFPTAAKLTDGEKTDSGPVPKKKMGRPPGRKMRAARLVEEACESAAQSEDDVPLIELRRNVPHELRRSARANKGQRKLDQMPIETPKKRNRAKEEEKERKKAEEEERRRKREEELQERERAALKAKKKKVPTATLR